MSDAATEYLAKKGYDPDNGARPLARVMQEEVKRPLGEELLFGALEDGGHVVVDVAGETLTFAYGPLRNNGSPEPLEPTSDDAGEGRPSSTTP